MKENSHRAPHWCYRSGDWTFLYTHARRLDGYRVYSAGDLRCPRASAAGRRPIRPALRELGWRGGAAQGAGRPPGGHRAVGGQSDRRPAARQGPARGDRAGAAARLRAGLRLRRLPRRRAPGPGPGAQALERDPLAGPALASQPTLSRFENAVGRQELYLASLGLADLVIEHHRARLGGRARRITIDLDPTDDPTHGQQEFTFFNGHYDTWCYLPVVATLTFNTEPTQYAVGAVLRPGNSPAKAGAIPLLRRLLARLRVAFPRARFRIRLDGGFASPEVFAFLEAEGVEYVVAMASNVRLVKRSRRLLGRARMLSKASGQTEHLYGETRYAIEVFGL